MSDGTTTGTKTLQEIREAAAAARLKPGFARACGLIWARKGAARLAEAALAARDYALAIEATQLAAELDAEEKAA